jgi:uncharacterized protein
MSPRTLAHHRREPAPEVRRWGTLGLGSSPLAPVLGTGLLLALLSFPAASQTPGQEGTGESETTLHVSGSAEVEVAPDRARIAFAVETEAETAREAGEENARLMDRAIQALRDTGVEGLRIESSGYQLQPRYRTVTEERLRQIAGYTARNTLQVIVDDVEAVGRLVDAGLAAGANRVAGLRFEIRDPDPHRSEALRRAIERAREEARVMATALGMELGLPKEVRGGAERPSPPPMFAMPAVRMEVMADAPTTPLEAGLQTVSASVSITYRLHPPARDR